MTFLRRLFGLDFPDPATGQVWRSLHSGRAIRAASWRDGHGWSIQFPRVPDAHP